MRVRSGRAFLTASLDMHGLQAQTPILHVSLNCTTMISTHKLVMAGDMIAPVGSDNDLMHVHEACQCLPGAHLLMALSRCSMKAVRAYTQL